MEPTLAAIDTFAEIVEANDLDGLPFQHYARANAGPGST